MNPIIREAADGAQLGWLMALTTVVFVLAFLFWVWWAWTARNRARWEADSRLPLNDGGES
ncbi:MAG: CcoQ/FixQ family Cbb3-type cytochrome c oxidase assembly chaperone [Gemmatimonadota bacterium]